MGGWWIIKLETQCLRQQSKLETQALRLGLGFLVFVRMIWIGLVVGQHSKLDPLVTLQTLLTNSTVFNQSITIMYLLKFYNCGNHCLIL